MVSLALFAPSVVGVNTTTTVVADPPESEVAAGAPTENCAASAPAMVNGGVNATSAVLLFVIVIVALPADPSATDPKSCGAGVTLNSAGAGALVEVLRIAWRDE